MLANLPGGARKTVSAGKAYDIAPFIEGCWGINVTPHVAQNTTNRASGIGGRTTRHAGYHLSLIFHKVVETVFEDAKQHGILRQVKLRGRKEEGRAALYARGYCRQSAPPSGAARDGVFRIDGRV